MAGIITDVSEDIKKLQELKIAIADVKSELKSINIKVDIDIAKGLEGQLKSLTDQYNELVVKVSNSEAKILLSVKKINDASDKIIQAQEKLSQASGMQPKPQTGAGSPSSADVSSIQAQAKAYDELETEINGVLGTRAENVKRMVDELNSIRMINAEIKSITKSQSENSSLSVAQQKRLEQLNNSLLTHKAALSEVRQTLNNNAKMDNAAASSMNGLSQSLSRMRIAYRELTEEERNSPFGKELLSSIQQADVKIKELDATIGNHQRNVGNYASGWNGLSMSIQQVGRELPSLAYGPKVFFSAISNNLPILADEIKRTKDKIKELKEAGEEVEPLWKQLAKGVFSWQTALTVGITLLTLYGDKLVDWVAGLFKAKDATEENRKALEAYNAFVKKSHEDWANSVAGSASSQLSEYKKLQRKWDELANDLQAKKKFIEDNETAFHNLGFAVNTVTDAENLLVKNTDAVVQAIMARAEAAAYEENITEAMKRRIKQEQYNKNTVAGGGYYNKIQAGNNPTGIVAEELRNLKEGVDYTISSFQTATGLTITKFTLAASGAAKINAKRYSDAQKRLKENNDRAKKEYEDTVKESEKGLNDSIKKTKDLSKQINVRLYEGWKNDKANPDKTDNDNERKRAQEQLAKDLEKIEQQHADNEVAIKEESTEKKLAQIQNEYDKTIAEVNRQKKEFQKNNKTAGITGLTDGLTEEQTNALQALRDDAAKKKEKQTQEVYRSELESMRNYLKEYGTFQQQKLAITEEYAEKIAKAGPEVEKLSLAKQRDEAIREKSDQKIINRVDWVSSFGELGNTFDTLIKNALEELNAYIQTDEFKNRTADEKKTVLDARNQLQGQVSNDATFERLNKQINDYRQKLANLSYYENSHALAIKSRMDAEQARDKIEDKGSKEYEEANRKVILSKELEKSTAEELISSENAVKEAQDGVADTAQKLNANLDNFSNGLNQLTSGTLSGTVDGLTNLFKSLGLSDDIMKKFKDTLKNGLSFLFGDQIGGMLADSLDVLQGFLTGDLQGAIISAVTGMIDNILQGITKGGIITKPIKALVGGLQGIVNTITFGGLNSWLRSGSNAREVAETMARLTERNEKLTQAIDNLRDTMDKTAGRESIAAYEEAYKYQKEIIENQKEKAKAQAGYHNQHHSWASYMGWSPEMLALASNITGINFTGTESLWELSPEQMQRLLGNMTISDAIASAGKGGYGGRVLAQLQEYADYAGSLEDLTKQINESITQISFDSLRDNFMSTLMDMESGAKDFAEDWREIIQRAMLNFALGDQLDEELKKLYQKLSDTMQTANGHLTESQIEAFAAEYDALAEKGIQIRDEIASITGYKGNNGGSDTSGGSASKGYTATASQDSIDRVEGRVTGIQICCEQIRVADEQRNERLNLITAKLDDIIEGRKDSSINGIAEEMRDVAVKCYMELQQIGENTSESSKLLSAIRKDINDIKKNL